MPLVMCPNCESTDVDVRAKHADGSMDLICEECGNAWSRAAVQAAAPSAVGKTPLEVAKAKFPTPAMVDSGRAQQVEALKVEFLGQRPAQDPDVTAYWDKYQRVFSAEGLWECNPQDLKDFANNSVGAHPGNMSVFNNAWNDLGTPAAAERVRHTIEYLLRGPASVPVEDRLTDLIVGRKGMGMTGFRESLLTRVLCVVHPDRFVPILTYSGDGTGKRDIAQAVFGLRMPKQDQVSMQIGRLVLWSNDLLNELLGEGFESRQHASAFLWWAKDKS